jgi:hypothetical protein
MASKPTLDTVLVPGHTSPDIIKQHFPHLHETPYTTLTTAQEESLKAVLTHRATTHPIFSAATSFGEVVSLQLFPGRNAIARIQWLEEKEGELEPGRVWQELSFSSCKDRTPGAMFTAITVRPEKVVKYVKTLFPGRKV